MSLVERWNQWQQRYEQRFIKRERALIALALVTAMSLGAWQLWVTPALTERVELQKSLAELHAGMDALESERAALAELLMDDSAVALRDRRERLQRRLATLERELEAKTDGLIGPEAMVDLLESMLRDHDGVHLQAVLHHTPEPVSMDGSTPVTEDEQFSGEHLFAHNVEVVVRGDYGSVVAYLKALETLDDRLGWHRLEYQVREWPEGEVRIQLQTLSLHEEWLGV